MCVSLDSKDTRLERRWCCYHILAHECGSEEQDILLLFCASTNVRAERVRRFLVCRVGKHGRTLSLRWRRLSDGLSVGVQCYEAVHRGRRTARDRDRRLRWCDGAASAARGV